MSIAPCLDFYQLPNFLPSESLYKEPGKALQTPIIRLNDFLVPMPMEGRFTEWGVPSGSIARLLPAMIAKALKQECLWISDVDSARIYPNSWTGLGFDLNNIHFLHEHEPLASLRTVIHENAFPFLILDCKQRLEKSDLHFLTQSCRQQGTTLFLFRPFYLSNKNGNPFSQLRINSSYSISKKSFQLSVIKGRQRKSLQLKFSEVLCG